MNKEGKPLELLKMGKLIDKIPVNTSRNSAMEWLVFGVGCAMLTAAIVGTVLPPNATIAVDTAPRTETVF